MIKFWYPDRQYLDHKEEFDAAMQRVLTSGELILREDGERFEENLASFLGVSHVVAVASGTDALMLSLKATNIKRGDEVLVPSYTFRATLEAIHHIGARPVVYDLDGNFKKYVTRKTAAIIPCHLEGRIWDNVIEMEIFCRDNGIILLEDSCQAIGASSLRGSTASYSFYPAKILGCFGDGGAIATNNEHLAGHLRKMRNHYKGDWKADYGFNSRLDNLQAAVLNVKMKYLQLALARRKQIAARYDKELVGFGLPMPRDIYQDYVVIHPEPFNVVKHLAEQGIQALENRYPFPALSEKKPLARDYEEKSLRIPCTPEHTDEELTQVIAAMNSYGK